MDSNGSLNEGASEDKDFEAEICKLKKQTKKQKELVLVCKTKKKALSKSYLDSDNEETRAKKTTTKNNDSTKFVELKEVEDLIKQLNSMSLNDLDYGYLCFKALKMDKDVEKLVRKLFTGNPQGNIGCTPILAGQTPRRDVPPHVAPQNMDPQNMAPPANDRYISQPPMKCYGCGKLGHGIT